MPLPLDFLYIYPYSMYICLSLYIVALSEYCFCTAFYYFSLAQIECWIILGQLHFQIN